MTSASLNKSGTRLRCHKPPTGRSLTSVQLAKSAIEEIWCLVVCLALATAMKVSFLSLSPPPLVLVPPTGSFSEGGEVHHHPRLLPGRDATKQAQGDEPLRVETGHVGVVSAVFAVAVVTAARPDSQGRDERCLRNLFQTFLVVVLIQILGFITFHDGSKSGLQC